MMTKWDQAQVGLDDLRELFPTSVILELWDFPPPDQTLGILESL